MTIIVLPHIDIFDFKQELIKNKIIPEDFDLYTNLLGDEISNDTSYPISLIRSEPYCNTYIQDAIDYLKYLLDEKGIEAEFVFFDVCR